MDSNFEKVITVLNKVKGTEEHPSHPEDYEKLWPYFEKALTREDFNDLIYTEEADCIFYTVSAKLIHDILFGKTEIIFNEELTLKDSKHKQTALDIAGKLTTMEGAAFIKEISSLDIL